MNDTLVTAIISASIPTIVGGILLYFWNRRLEKFKSKINKELEREKGVIQVEVQKELEPFKKQLEKNNSAFVITYQELVKKRFEKLEVLYCELERLKLMLTGIETLSITRAELAKVFLGILNLVTTSRLYLTDSINKEIDDFINHVQIIMTLNHERNNKLDDDGLIVDTEYDLLIEKRLQSVTSILEKIETLIQKDIFYIESQV